ncbi:outer membrane protein assembly factor BamB [Aliiglaciecola sp. CAU 1673]|uniref:outer membrane protein assembly factor BamB n=1 Tax=Aliiglaciecola sp. CAU 1673 TaxID=3032595 RepID=UPI0023DC596F|nr:outer membrane protein assembly factor BamB [Aliiglaciecola sp. CAU 1673]MDF2178937.1 outer membrane protein assembly factor BamB [Aliiglaciecola sp. CAU 1673]
MKNCIKALCLLSVLGMSGCSVLPDWMDARTWFMDDEEIEIKKLKPIESQFMAQAKWERSVGDGVGEHFSRLKPAVAYEKVFAASRHGMVKAFERDSGKLVWEQNLAIFKDDSWYDGVAKLWRSGAPARIAGGLSVSYEKVFLGTENGDVFALDVNTGEVKWRAKVKGEVLARPAVDEGTVVVNTGAGVMFALDAETGEQRWRYESEVPPLSLRGVSAASISSGGAIVGTASGKLAAVILNNGQIAWEQAVAAPTGATELERIVDIDVEPLVLGGMIYVVSFDGTLAAVDIRSGRVVWKREYKSYRRISLDANNLFVVDNNSVVYALDRRSGVELWSHNSLRGRQLTAAEPVASYVVVGDKFGFLHWLNQSDGKIVSRLQVGGDDVDEGIYTDPVVEGRVVYTQTRDGELWAIETP